MVRKKTSNDTEFIILLLDHFLVFRLLVFKILYNLSEYHMITQGMHKKKKENNTFFSVLDDQKNYCWL